MRYGSACSGIEAATVAWHPLGWEAAWFSEIEDFASRVLAHRWPTVANRGDFTKIGGEDEPALDVLVGGTPCQSFSIAGLRDGLDDARGVLALEFLSLARRCRARWLVWEGVPYTMRVDKGRAFGSILGGLAELGYGFAYRVLDSQYWGVPQRRRRIFVVGHRGDWRRAAAVLFERACLSWDPPPGRKAGPSIACYAADRALGGSSVARPLTRSCGTRLDLESETFVFSIVPESGQGADLRAAEIQVAPAITTEEAKTIDRGTRVVQAGRARRLTPLECERLQGFPDGYTDIPGAEDRSRYRVLGNSFAVPVISWIGQRIEMVERIAGEG